MRKKGNSRGNERGKGEKEGERVREWMGRPVAHTLVSGDVTIYLLFYSYYPWSKATP